MSIFLEEYIRENLEILKIAFPDMDEDNLRDIIQNSIDEKLSIPKCKLYNNYTKQSSNLDLIKFIDWVDKKKPILTEHGVCFKKHDEALNLNANMVEYITDSRNNYKKKMFECQRNNDSVGTKFYDEKQRVMKIFSNSYYGVAGQQQSIFYNINVALSITGKGQSIITTALTTFERFLSNNILFNDFDDCLIFINTIIKEETKFKDKKILDRNISREELSNYLINQFFNKEDGKKNKELLDNILKNVSQTKINRIYYKNNFFEFCSNEYILILIDKIISTTKSFKDPSKIPEETKYDIQIFWEYIKDYVFYNYPVFDRIYISKNIKRKSVIACDTDSNFLNLEPWYEFIIEKSSLSLDKKDAETTFKIINLITVVLSNVIREAFYKITELANVPEEKRKYISMKNEFLLKRMLLTGKKKNYAAVILLQEGIEKNPPKLDVKGLTIKKSNVNRNTGNYLQNILEKDILSSDKINTSEILKKLETFENEIRDSFQQGKTTYMKPDKVNNISAYKMPFSIPALRGVITWNNIYPNLPISFPAQVNTVKLTSVTIDKITPLYENKETKEIYNNLKKYVFDDENMGKYGLSIIALPKNIDRIPDWIIPLIDVDTIIRDNLSNFLTILNSIGVKTINIKADELFFSNIIDF